MAKKQKDTTLQDRAKALIAEVEGLAKRLRGDLRQRAEAFAVVRQMERAAGQLRKRAAAAAGQVERYAHRVRTELEKGVAKKAAPKRKKAASRRRAAAAPPAAAL